MSRRVKLCAIAQNEGPYLADWVFHHLHVGFDGVEVWVNGSHDTSVQIMEAVSAAYQQVSFRVVDELLEDSLLRGRWFQYRAYARLARRAERQGYTHAGFLDLDEYWLPQDLETSIHAFLPEAADVNVVSFPWGMDVPSPHRPAFDHPLAGELAVQLDPHVKSVVRLDDRVVQVRPHTARTTSGTRLLVRDPFPLAHEEGQQWGSFVPDDHFASTRDHLPEAFVLHAVHRSQTEYVGSLRKPQRTSTTDSRYRTNRRGFLARGGPVLPVRLPEPALARYLRARERFRAEVGVDALVDEATAFTSHRASSVIQDVVADPTLMERVRGVLHRVSAPALDQRYPGWDYHLEWCVDAVRPTEAGAEVTGWAFSATSGHDLEFGFRDAAGALWHAGPVDRSPRRDVVHVHPEAPPDSGFRVEVPRGLSVDAGTLLLARPTGSTVWSSLPLSAHLAGQRTGNP